MGVIRRYRGNRSDSRSPNLIIKGTKACHLPGLLRTYVTDPVEDVGRRGSVRDEDVVGKELDTSVHMLRRIDKSKKLGSIRRVQKIASVDNCPLDFEQLLVFGLRVVVVYHKLYLRHLGNGVEICHYVRYLNHICCYRFSRNRCYGR